MIYKEYLRKYPFVPDTASGYMITAKGVVAVHVYGYVMFEGSRLIVHSDITYPSMYRLSDASCGMCIGLAHRDITELLRNAYSILDFYRNVVGQYRKGAISRTGFDFTLCNPGMSAAITSLIWNV